MPTITPQRGAASASTRCQAESTEPPGSKRPSARDRYSDRRGRAVRREVIARSTVGDLEAAPPAGRRVTRPRVQGASNLSRIGLGAASAPEAFGGQGMPNVVG